MQIFSPRLINLICVFRYRQPVIKEIELSSNNTNTGSIRTRWI